MDYSEKEINNILKNKLPILNQNDIDNFLNITTYKKYGNKEIILKSGTSSKKAFLILNGVIRGCIIDKKGNEKNILIRSEGIFVADVRKLFFDEPQRLTFSTIGEAHILFFNYIDFEDLTKIHPNIMELYLNILKEAVARLTYRIESFIAMTHEERYIDLLKYNPKFLDKTYSKYIANFLGITNVSLSRIIKRVNKKKT
ncbi:MAG: Crp/Fnr family transcriptional regulator [Flavobacteriaceae bacterium]|nr:Crp/Fnr family transcriptional regulator [Flavobacteriaceae bacterium]